LSENQLFFRKVAKRNPGDRFYLAVSSAKGWSLLSALIAVASQRDRPAAVLGHGKHKFPSIVGYWAAGEERRPKHPLAVPFVFFNVVPNNPIAAAGKLPASWAAIISVGCRSAASK